jgi:hypothetical protein
LEFKKDLAQLCLDLFAHLPVDEWREFTVGLLKSCISFRDTTADAPAWERCRSPELPWWKALTEGFTRCRFHVETTDRTLEEVLAWFSQAMGPTLGPLLCGGTRMDQQRDSDWIEPLEATALSDDEEVESQTPVSIEGDMSWTGPGVGFRFQIRRRIRGRTLNGGYRGVSYDSPHRNL